MSVWFIIWFILSGALLYFMGWTLFILYRQKKAWKAYAERRKLRYKSEGLFTPPELAGVFKNYTVNLFTGEHVLGDIRKTRKLTAVEVKLSSIMPVNGGAASGVMVHFLQRLGFKEEYKPDHPDWQKVYVAASEDRRVLEDYMTDQRIQALINLMGIDKASVILVFQDTVMLLRVDTSDPLDSPQKIDRLLSSMIEAAAVLELKSGESARLKAQALRKKERKAVALDVEDDFVPSGLELEGEDVGESTGETSSDPKPDSEESGEDLN